MCCLIYENRIYEEFKAGLPRIGERVRLREGPGRVRKYNIFENAFLVELEFLSARERLSSYPIESLIRY